ncbi:MAG: HNH endonuclease signature motif containing protein [Scytonema sp. PMC 1069.18]|nr:HNH endonuclease signature motif containing protein [Scytonema sp. PMC 1069.18]MEC4886490.1 HNH endonuclease signature motif containing protein [Scytonema sp. PMC 1070.18]
MQFAWFALVIVPNQVSLRLGQIANQYENPVSNMASTGNSSLSDAINEIDKKNVIKEIASEKNFGALKIKPKTDTSEIQSKEFSRETKAATFIRDALPGCPQCKICGGYLPSGFSSIDHITRKADGGLGTLDNAQLTHPYCNTTYKN